MSSDELYQRPDGTPKKTGRELFASVATIRIDDTPTDNPRVAIHVEHPDHDGGVRCFHRRRDSDIEATIRSHLRTELGDDLTRVEVLDQAGVGIAEENVLPRSLARERPFEEATTVEVLSR